MDLFPTLVHLTTPKYKDITGITERKGSGTSGLGPSRQQTRLWGSGPSGAARSPPCLRCPHPLPSYCCQIAETSAKKLKYSGRKDYLGRKIAAKF